MIDRYAYKGILTIGFLSLFLILGINELAVNYHIYFVYKWFDTPMHFIGGFGVGILCVGILRAFLSTEIYDSKKTFWYTVAGVLFVGIIWEIVEAVFKVSVIFGGVFWIDTIKDLLMDVFGGILSYICFRHLLKK